MESLLDFLPGIRANLTVRYARFPHDLRRPTSFSIEISREDASIVEAGGFAKVRVESFKSGFRSIFEVVNKAFIVKFSK